MKNPNEQYRIGKGIAIGWFSKNNYLISLPISNHMPYDLLVDNGTIQRVRICTTSYKNPQGNYDVNLKVTNSNFYGVMKVRKFEEKDCDILFVCCDFKYFYLIPSEEIKTKTKITMVGLDLYRIDI